LLLLVEDLDLVPRAERALALGVAGDGIVGVWDGFGDFSGLGERVDWS
jgi:hypothetical protein